MTTIVFFSLLIVAFFFSTFAEASPKPAYAWNVLQEGLRYTSFSFPPGAAITSTIHAFEIDPARFTIDVALPEKNGGILAREMAAERKALIAINGGFFTPELRSIGLLVRNGEILRPLHRTSWWSVFSLEGGKARVRRHSEYAPTPETTFALQAGPRLVVDGVVARVKGERTHRSALGITPNGRVVMVATEGAGLTMQELANLFALSRWQGGLECPHAMNLDGGGSTQLYANVGKLLIDLPGLTRVANGIVVLPKTANNRY